MYRFFKSSVKFGVVMNGFDYFATTHEELIQKKYQQSPPIEQKLLLDATLYALRFYKQEVKPALKAIEKASQDAIKESKSKP